MTIKRLCVFAHYDKDNLLDPYVMAYIAALQPHTDKIVFVSTCQLSKGDLDRLSESGVLVVCRENIGYDFYSWKIGLEYVNLDEYDEFLQVNDSCYAPLFQFDRVFDEMASVKCDFWSITKSYYFARHAQSYFVCYRKPVLRNPHFQNFWKSLKVLKDKREIIKSYEVGLSRLLINQRFKFDHYFKLSFSDYLKAFPRNFRLKVSVTRNLNPYKYLRGLVLSNPTCHFAQEMLDRRVPLVKIALIKGDPFTVPAIDLSSVNEIDTSVVRLISRHQLRVNLGKGFEAWVPNALTKTSL